MGASGIDFGEIEVVDAGLGDGLGLGGYGGAGFVFPDAGLGFAVEADLDFDGVSTLEGDRDGGWMLTDTATDLDLAA